MENILDAQTISILIRLSVALLLGLIIGTERVWAHKTAGMRTYALVSMGAALFIVISEMISIKYFTTGGLDPTRMASQIIVGIGFLGTGLIFSKESKLIGLTTATGLWVSAGIGMAVGFEFFNLAIIATALTLFTFTVLWLVEEQIKQTKYFRDNIKSDIN
ncbi:MAG: MgtC/SapB family protein [Candidatus Pacebacteria bacterium]|nr:MgtC/SapB family protein [Candidatus Paceibacterota bacterium]